MPGHHSRGSDERRGSYELIYSVVRRIPRGRVASYGEVARWAGLPGRARQVGYALHSLPSDSPVPWHRVIGAGGRVSPRRDPSGERVQRQLLESEGVGFDPGGRVLPRHAWQPRSSRVEPRVRP